MIDIDVDEFTEDHAGQLALECQKLEDIFRTGLESYDNSAALIGKKWYSVGLENIDRDKEKDSSNKKNILLRMIESVVNFIKAIAAKIVAWFKACKAAVMKFFGQDKVDPKDVTERFDLLLEGLTEGSGNKNSVKEIIAKINEETKKSLAEILDDDYHDHFISVYTDYMGMRGKCDNVQSFSKNYAYFEKFKEKSADLKDIIVKKKVYENADKTLEKILTGNYSVKVRGIVTVFEAVEAIHQGHTQKLEALLKKIPEDNLDGVEGDNVDNKRRDMVKLISDVLKIEGEMILKSNQYMQAAAMLMNYIVQYRTKRLVYIPV